MAGFDKNLDKELFGETIKLDGTKIRVSVFSYNENKPKLQLSRENLTAEGEDFRFAKLGRLTKEEVELVLPVIDKAMKFM